MKRRLGGASLTAVFLLVCAAPAMAQVGTGQTHGTVFDSRREGVAGLTVALIPEAGPIIMGTTTDEAGIYAFRKLAGGTYSVVLRDPGVGVARKDGVRVRPLFRSIVDFNVPADLGDHTVPAPVPAPSPATADGSDGTIVLTGTVVDVQGNPVPDASVKLTPFEAQGRLGRSRTDQAGRCQIPLTPGTYRIVVSAPGFMTWSLAPVPLEGTGSLSLSLVLVSFPMGFEGTLEDLLLPQDPIPPEGDEGDKPRNDR